MAQTRSHYLLRRLTSVDARRARPVLQKRRKFSSTSHRGCSIGTSKHPACRSASQMRRVRKISCCLRARRSYNPWLFVLNVIRHSDVVVAIQTDARHKSQCGESCHGATKSVHWVKQRPIWQSTGGSVERQYNMLSASYSVSRCRHREGNTRAPEADKQVHTRS